MTGCVKCKQSKWTFLGRRFLKFKGETVTIGIWTCGICGNLSVRLETLEEFKQYTKNAPLTPSFTDEKKKAMMEKLERMGIVHK